MVLTSQAMVIAETAVPKAGPEPEMENAKARSFTGAHSRMARAASGKVGDSPMPSSSRVKNTKEKLVAAPVSAVAADQKAMHRAAVLRGAPAVQRHAGGQLARGVGPDEGGQQIADGDRRQRELLDQNRHGDREHGAVEIVDQCHCEQQAIDDEPFASCPRPVDVPHRPPGDFDAP